MIYENEQRMPFQPMGHWLIEFSFIFRKQVPIKEKNIYIYIYLSWTIKKHITKYKVFISVKIYKVHIKFIIVGEEA